MTESSRLEAARRWIEADPDPATRAELEALLESGAHEAVAERMAPLEFGTAGLRAAVGAGSARMNRAVVLRTACGIAQHLRARGRTGPVVIAFDARPTSRGFAEASAGVLLAQGFPVVAFLDPAPTPWAAFAARELSAGAAIVVTASHNPRGDNGYKVYGANAVQLVPPEDTEIASLISAAPPARDVPCVSVSFAALQSGAVPPPGFTAASEELVAAYYQALARALPAGSLARDLRIVHSALHGVGAAPVARALHEAGFVDVRPVAEQAEPDGTFPTTPFPNPEEPGTMDLALLAGVRERADVVLVNDPDADRMAAAARLEGDELTALDGNQLGALLADFRLSRGGFSQVPLVLSSVVSSPLVERIARAYGARHERTLTGFKWLWSAALAISSSEPVTFAFAYEEALGYSVSEAVRDKDGVSAARALAELAAAEKARGRTLFDRLFDLYGGHGLWVSAATNVALTSEAARRRAAEAVAAIARNPPSSLDGLSISNVVDYSHGEGSRPVWLGRAPLVELELEGGARVLLRPSGTEPKLKLYGHVGEALDPAASRRDAIAAAKGRAARLLRALERALALS